MLQEPLRRGIFANAAVRADGRGEFVVTGSPEASCEQSDIEKLAEAIRRNPGQSKQSIIEASGVAQGRARTLLDRFDGRFWRTERGQRKTKLLFPADDPVTGARSAETDK